MMATDDRTWWVAVDNTRTGPYGLQYVIASLRTGLIHRDQPLCPIDGDKWKPAKHWPEFVRHVPTQQANAPDQDQTIVPSKQATAGNSDWIKIGAIYGLIVNPILWCIGVAASCVTGTYLAPEAPSFQWEALIWLLGQLAGFVMMLSWLLSGSWLRARALRGVWVAIASYVTAYLIFFVLCTLYVILGIAADGQPVAPSSTASTVVTVLSFSIGLLEYLFQTVLIVMLWRNRNSLQRIEDGRK